jgi:hypothetical protein
MHLGRFHRAIEMLASEYRELNPVALLANLAGTLNSVAANPGNPDVAKAFRNQLDACRESLMQSELNSPRPVLKVMLESIDAPQFIGSKLFTRIMQAIEGNAATPSLAVQEVARLQATVERFYGCIIAIDSAFTQLQVEYDDLDPGEGELGLLIPRAENASGLMDLSKEFKEWGRSLEPLTELFDPSAGPLQIRTCATTDWMVYLITTPPILGGFALCLKGINSILRELVESRSIIEQLIKRKAPPAAIEVLEADSQDKLDKDMRQLAEKLVDENYKSVDDGRKNELKNAINVSLKQIAQKVSLGTKFELRYIPEKRPDIAQPENVEVAESQGERDQLESLAIQLDSEVDLLDFSADPAVIQGFLQSPSSQVEAVEEV